MAYRPACARLPSEREYLVEQWGVRPGACPKGIENLQHQDVEHPRPCRLALGQTDILACKQCRWGWDIELVGSGIAGMREHPRGWRRPSPGFPWPCVVSSILK